MSSHLKRSVKVSKPHKPIQSEELRDENDTVLEILLYQLYETELGGREVYRAALKCAVNRDLNKEWSHYLSETEKHIEIARELLVTAGLEPEADIPQRLPLRVIGEALVKAIETAQECCDETSAELTAGECVVLAETKDHLNWELVGAVLKTLEEGDLATALQRAYKKIEKEEDHHLYHTTGWTRELWFDALGLPAALPPPEEKKDIDTALAAAKIKAARSEAMAH